MEKENTWRNQLQVDILMDQNMLKIVLLTIDSYGIHVQAEKDLDSGPKWGLFGSTVSEWCSQKGQSFGLAKLL